jgi:rhomboid family GlyGly-CTERM serine protease
MTLLFLSFALRLAGNEGIALFQYQRSAILEGEYWRVLSGHLVHGTWQHWLLNAVGLSLLWAIFPRHLCNSSTALLSLGIALLTSSALLVLDPAVSWYLGMSALLHGLLVAWLVADLLNGKRMAGLLLLLVGLKLAYEQWFGPLPGSIESTGLPVLVNAHLYGALSGGLFGVLLFVRRSKSNTA